MDGRGAEDETVVTIHIAKLGLSGPYQTALRPRRQTSRATTSSVLADLCAHRRHAWASHAVQDGIGCLDQGNKVVSSCPGTTPKFPYVEITHHNTLSAPSLRLSLSRPISTSIESKLCASYAIWAFHQYTRNWDFLLHKCCHDWLKLRLGLVRALGCCRCRCWSALNGQAGLR